MKGYYTVELVGGTYAATERMGLEARYAAALEARLGGHEAATQLILGCGAGDEPRGLVLAREGALADVPALPPGARFVLRAWNALDL